MLNYSFFYFGCCLGLFCRQTAMGLSELTATCSGWKAVFTRAVWGFIIVVYEFVTSCDSFHKSHSHLIHCYILNLLITWSAMNQKQPDGILLGYIIRLENRLEENRPGFHYKYKIILWYIWRKPCRMLHQNLSNQTVSSKPAKSMVCFDTSRISQ